MRLILWRMIQILVIVAALTLGLIVLLNPARCAPDCTGANLTGATLDGTNLNGSRLVEARLSNATLLRAQLAGADLSGAVVRKAALLDANLSQALLVGTDFSSSDMRGANLAGANLSGADLSGVNLTRVDLRGAASLRGVLLANALMVEAQLAGVDLSGVALIQANLTSANLVGANLAGANLSGATLAGADLREADLSGALINLADLSGADLRGAKLVGASLIGSSATSARFNQANLSGATVIGSRLDGADLRNANISGARFLEREITDLDIQVDPRLVRLSESQLGKIIQNAQLEGVLFDDTVSWTPEQQVTLESLLGFSISLPATAVPTDTAGVALGLVAPGKQQGRIGIGGSATVAAITQAIASLFYGAGFGGQISNEVSDTGPGLERLCQRGDIDIANASRAITEQEQAACAARLRTPVGLRIGSDAIVVAVHPDNSFITDATAAELQKIFTVDKWSDVNPRWPQRPIQRFVPAVGSGTRSFFAQTVGLREDDLSAAANTVTSQDAGALAEGLANSPFGVALLSYGTFQQHMERIQAINVDGAAPSSQNVEDRRYLLARPLYIYSDVATLRRKPQVAAFITFYLQNVTAISQKTGFFPPSETMLHESAQTLLNVLKRSQ